jgi:hypothetical protein
VNRRARDGFFIAGELFSGSEQRKGRHRAARPGA